MDDFAAAANPLEGARYTGKVRQQMRPHNRTIFSKWPAPALPGTGATDTDVTDLFVYDGVSRLVQSQQWVRRSPDAGADIFDDDFESGNLSAWNIPQETYPAIFSKWVAPISADRNRCRK